MTHDDDRNLAFHDEFDKRFVRYTYEADTYEEAYHKTELDYKRAFPGKGPKYASYNSFRVSRSQRLKRKKEASA